MRRLCAIAFTVALASCAALAQNSSVTGTVTDARSGEPLIGANVFLEGTAIGGATGGTGQYRLPTVPPGRYVLVGSYIGYQKIRREITLRPDSQMVVNLALRYDDLKTDEVVVTAQLEGQAAAINQQLSANSIVNIVSSDRIRELPDYNAAESIGRLPGISVQRNAGEGQKLVVRGLSPRFNAITINGQRIPSTDPEDRSVDLSMVSQDVLAGIEVFKALTADKDADAVGGTVNLVLAKAPSRLRADLLAQGGYNDHAGLAGDYKFVLSLGDRLAGDLLGVLVSGNAQRANRGSHTLTGGYVFQREQQGGEELPVFYIEDLNVGDRLETRYRYGGSVAVDLDLREHTFFLSTIYSRTDRDEVRRRKRYRVGEFRVEHDLHSRELNTSLFSGSLRGTHLLGASEVVWQGSYSSSRQDQPDYVYARFVEVGAYVDGLIDNQGPSVIPQFARDSLDATYFQYSTFNPEEVRDYDLVGQVDYKLPFVLGSWLAGTLKGGGKIRDKNRTKDLSEYRTPFGEVDDIGQENPGLFTLYRNQHIQIANFLDPSFTGMDIIDNRYRLNAWLLEDPLVRFRDTYRGRFELNRYVELQDYEAGETVTAGYLLLELNLGTDFFFIPGIRYEHARNRYVGKFGRLQGNLGEIGEIRDTTGGQDYGEWLPMIHARYRITPWMDVRAAVTRTLSRPSYFNLVPYESINYAEQIILRGNPTLRHTKAWNYDLFFSLYDNTVGLFTLGLFYKSLEDIDYISQTRLVSGEFNGFQLTEPVNGSDSKVYGFELDLQTNLRFLPSPFDGIVINANYSYAYSETYFPFFEIGPRSPLPPFRPTIINTFRKGTLPGQADHLGNVAVGYEKGGFSGRLSLTYKGKSLETIGTREELDGYWSEYWRVDATLSQEVLDGLRLFLSFNNLTDTSERTFLGFVEFPTREEIFGWTGSLGVRYVFKAL